MYSINVQCAYFNALLYPDHFRALGVPYVAVSGDTGDIGGSLSHEFQFPAEVGQDSLLVCPECERGSNVEVCKNNRILGNLPFLLLVPWYIILPTDMYANLVHFGFI